MIELVDFNEIYGNEIKKSPKKSTRRRSKKAVQESESNETNVVQDKVENKKDLDVSSNEPSSEEKE
jgi:hypothetical protein